MSEIIFVLSIKYSFFAQVSEIVTISVHQDGRIYDEAFRVSLSSGVAMVCRPYCGLCLRFALTHQRMKSMRPLCSGPEYALDSSCP